MNALLLVAHGSRREESNQEIRELTARLAGHDHNTADHTAFAFLELAEPSIPNGIQQCIDHGATRVVVFPYFLSKGRHVAEDIPALVQPKVDEHPDIEIVVADYLGAREAVVETVAREAAAAIRR